jgi:cytochrome P450
MVTLTSRAAVEAALADPLLVPLPAESGPEGSMAWLRATVARFAHGEVHARRRVYVEAEVARIDVDGLRRLAAGAFGDDRTRVVRALAAAMALPDWDDAALAALFTVADNYFGGTDPDADDAVKLLLPLMLADDPEEAANRIGILVQACDATTALIRAAREGSGDVHATVRDTPPVHVMRRVAIGATRIEDGERGVVEIPEGEPVLVEVGPLGLAFGIGPRVCPGRALALALAEGALASEATEQGAPTRSAQSHRARPE